MSIHRFTVRQLYSCTGCSDYTIYGIITGSLSANSSRAKYIILLARLKNNKIQHYIRRTLTIKGTI